MSADEINDQLRKALQFTPGDLEANRAGRLSDSQASEVSNELLFQVITYGGLLIVVATISVHASSNRLVSVIVGAAAIVFIVGVFYQKWRVDVRQRLVLSAVGPLSKESYTNDQMLGRTDYTLIVSGERIGVSEQGYRVFTEGETYRVFYTAQGRQVISAEYLG